jgi:cell surface protein SprA
VQYRAVANSFIRQPSGSLDPNSPWYDAAGADTIDISQQFLQGGTRRNYMQALDINYRIPIDKIIFLDWITAQVSYGSIYNWIASPISVQSRLGNAIENSRNIQFNGTIDMTKLYGRIPYLKTLNQSSAAAGQRGRPGTTPKPPEPKVKDTTGAKPNYFKIIGDQFLRLLMAVKRGTLTYSEGTGTLLPGFMPSPQVLGVYWPDNAPGIGFAFGSQKDIKQKAGDEGWLTRDTLLNQAYATKYTTNLSARLTLEPFQGFKIELNADRTFARNHSEFYRADSAGIFAPYSEKDMGSFSMSYITWGTAFGVDYDTSRSETFEQLKAYRYDIAYRLAGENPNSAGTVYDSITQEYYPTGYGPTAQDVLIPSFLAAYGKRDPNTIYTGYFPKIPLPNWRVTYDGLTKIKVLADVFRSATLTHAYRSVYAISAYQSNLYYQVDTTYQMPNRLYPDANAYFPEYDIGQVTIQEQFAPLFGIDLSWNNSLLTRFEIRKSRTLTFSMANLQLTDLNTDEYVIGLGYKIQNVSFTVSSMGGGGRKTKITSDLDIKIDFSIRNNRTVLRRVDQNIDQVSAGQRVFSINTSLDYMLSKSVTMSLFFDRIMNKPFVSNQYPNSTTKGGISIRFSLAQ